VRKSHTHSNSNSYSYSNRYSNGYCYSDSYSYPDCDCYGYGNSDTQTYAHTEACANCETPPDASASSVTGNPKQVLTAELARKTREFPPREHGCFTDAIGFANSLFPKSCNVSDRTDQRSLINCR
jgi:hypothetical protein